jgi:hypothetical protein
VFSLWIQVYGLIFPTPTWRSPYPKYFVYNWIFLTPKIPCGFSTKLGSFGHSWRNHFPQKLNVRNKESNYRFLKLPYGTSTSKIYNPSFRKSYKIITIKDQSFFFGSIFTMKFFTPKFMKIRCYLGIFITFGSDFQIKLAIYGSSLSLTCLNMSELEFFCERRSMFKT